MDLVIHHDQHYAFDIVGAHEVVPGDFTVAGNDEGHVGRRVVIDKPKHSTTVHIPESVFERNLPPVAKSRHFSDREECTAYFLRVAGMIHHSEPEWWTHIECDDADVQAHLHYTFLRKRGGGAGTGGGKPPKAPFTPPGPRQRAAVRTPNGWKAIFTHSVNGGPIRWNHNLRTNDGIDWQSAMDGGPSMTGSWMSGTATATSATSITATGTPFPVTGGFGNTTTSPLAGYRVYALTAKVYGVIQTHTSSVLTVDRWNSPTAPGGAAGSTPGATEAYLIVPGLSPTWWMALTSDSAAPAVTDHTLASELTTNGFARALGGWSHTNGVNTATLNNIYTSTQASGSTTINKEMIANAQAGGIMTFESAEPSPPTLVLNDTLNQSVITTM